MSDPSLPPRERIRAQLEDKGTARKLFLAAYRITGSPTSAQDLINDAVEQVLKRFPWEKRTFLTHMTFVMIHVWDQQQRAFSVQKETPDEDVTRGLKGFSREPPADDELHRRRELAVLRKLLDQLLASVGPKHARVTECIELGLRGIESPAEQAAILGCPVDEVYEAHRLIQRHGARIREEWERAEEQRMRELRERLDPKRQKEAS